MSGVWFSNAQCVVFAAGRMPTRWFLNTLNGVVLMTHERQREYNFRIEFILVNTYGHSSLA